MDNLSLFGDRLTEFMIVKGIDNKELADAIGIHVTTLQRWKRNAKFIFLSNLLKLANFFNCSIDFLLGRTENQLDYIPRECTSFYQRFRQVMQEKGVSRYRMDKETKIKDSYFTSWSKGTDPHVFSLIEAADYLEVTVDYLVGRDC